MRKFHSKSEEKRVTIQLEAKKERSKKIGELLKDNLTRNLEEKYGKDDSKWPGQENEEDKDSNSKSNTRTHKGS